MRKVFALIALSGLGLPLLARGQEPRDGDAAAGALAARNAPRALELAREGLSRSPGNPWLLYDEGCALVELGRIDEALAALRAAEQAFPGAHERSLATFRRALALAQAGRCAEATAEFAHDAAIRDPRDAGPRLANVYLGACVTVPQPAPPPAVPYAPLTPPLANRAAAAMVAGDHARALVLADEGLVAVPDDPWLLYDRGIALVDLGRTDEGIAALRAAEKHFPALHEQSLAAFRRGIAYQEIGRCDEAAREWRHYVALVGDSDPKGADLARQYAESCPTRHPWTVGKATSSPPPK